MSKERNIREVAARQGGVISRRQAIEAGYTPKMIAGRLRAGDWTPVSRGVYRLIDARTHRDLVHGAVVTLPTAVVSHQSAARLHRIPKAPDSPPTVTVHASTTHRFDGVVVHRTRDLADHHVVDVAGLPVTTIPRTVVDLAAHVSVHRLGEIVDELVVSSAMKLDDLVAVVGEVARRGKPGSASLRTVLAERTDLTWATSTRMERLGLAVLAAAGLPRPETQVPIPWSPDRRFDAAYPWARLAIEWDSRRWHLRAADFERDRRRDRAAAVHGWTVLRVTWLDLKTRPEDVAADVAAVLSLASSRH